MPLDSSRLDISRNMLISIVKHTIVNYSSNHFLLLKKMFSLHMFACFSLFKNERERERGGEERRYINYKGKIWKPLTSKHMEIIQH